MKNIIKLILIPVCLLFLTSCDDMNSLHQEYLDRGEATYPGKIESVDVHRGKNKVRFVWEIRADPRITETEISWTQNVERKTTKVNVTEKRPAEGGPVTVDATIDNLPETDIYFEFVTIDALGNRSVAFGQTVSIYGDIYIEALRPRRATVVPVGLEEPIKLEWSAADDIMVKTVLSYESASGHVERVILPGETQTVLTDFVSGRAYSATTYSVVENAMDTIRLTSSGTFRRTYMYERSGFIVAADSRHPWGADGAGKHLPISDGGLPSLLFDGDNTSGWHSNTGRYCPHYVWVGMHEIKTVTHVRIVNNPGGLGYLNNIKIYKCKVRPSVGFTDDNQVDSWFAAVDMPDTWEFVTDVVFPANDTHYLVELEEPLETEYLIIWFVNTQPYRGSQRYSSFTELEIYGID